MMIKTIHLILAVVLIQVFANSNEEKLNIQENIMSKQQLLNNKAEYLKRRKIDDNYRFELHHDEKVLLKGENQINVSFLNIIKLKDINNSLLFHNYIFVAVNTFAGTCYADMLSETIPVRSSKTISGDPDYPIKEHVQVDIRKQLKLPLESANYNLFAISKGKIMKDSYIEVVSQPNTQIDNIFTQTEEILIAIPSENSQVENTLDLALIKSDIYNPNSPTLFTLNFSLSKAYSLPRVANYVEQVNYVQIPISLVISSIKLVRPYCINKLVKVRCDNDNDILSGSIVFDLNEIGYWNQSEDRISIFAFSKDIHSEPLTFKTF